MIHLKIALRNLRRHTLYAGVNVIGLALGLACCTFIVLYVLDEWSYDRFHAKADRVVRFVEDQASPDHVSRLATTYGPLAPALEEDMAVVEHAVRVLPYSVLVSRDVERKYQEDRFVFADSTFFDVFSFPVRQGNTHTALHGPFTVVLTASTARRYFGEEDPVGQSIQVRDDEQDYTFTVTAVVEDPPSNTHLPFDFIASFAGLRIIYGDWIDDTRNWDHPPLYTYALLTERATVADLESLMPAFARRHMGETRTATRSLHAEKLTNIHLHSRREREWTPGSDIAHVILFALIAFFTLLIACVNFMNLATARSIQRAKEVGMRKALGAGRAQLIRQFLAESMLLSTVALAFALVLVFALLPAFNSLSGKTITAGALLHWSMPFIMLAVIGVVGLLAGSYPAFYLSGFRPARVLRGTTGITGIPGASALRKGLVVFQFVISIALLISTVVVNRQLHYVRNERLGFDKEHVVVVPLRALDDQFEHEALKKAWQELPNVRAVTASSGMPGLGGGIYDWWVRPENSADSLRLMVLTVDHDYAETYGLSVVAGRDFSEDFTSDATEAFLLNESAARKLGWMDPVGKELTLEVWFRTRIEKVGTVVGLVRDFQYNSLHHAIDPLIFHILPNSYYYNYLSVRVQPHDIPATLAAMERAWRAHSPERPFEFTFLDEQFDAQYHTEERLGGLLGVFSGLAIAIACLGLFGLSAFTAVSRTKEIGVRKVLGATVPSIVGLLSRDFVKLVGIAFVVAAPMAYYGMSRWLNGFAYRIEISWQIYLIAGSLALAVAVLTVSYQSVRAALADPVTSLRYE